MNWPAKPLAEVAEVRLGRQRAPKNHHGDSMRPYLRAANVTWRGLNLEDVKWMNFTDAELAVYRLVPGDIVLNEASGSPGEVGKPAIWSGEIKDCAFQNTLIRVRPQEHDPAFLLHYLRFQASTGRFVEHSRGVGIHHLGRARLASWPVPVPTIDQQRRIVGFLEDHLSRIEVAERNLAAATRKLRMLREAAATQTLTGSTQLELSSHVIDPVGTADGELRTLPSGWSWTRLGEVADVIGGVTKDSKKQGDPSYVEVPYLRVANVQRGRLELGDIARIRVAPAKANALRLEPGDVLLNEGGDRDKLARGWVWEGQLADCIHQNHVFRARITDPRLDPYFLSWVTNTFGGRWAERNGKQSVNLASISLSMIRKMPVIVPPLGEAERIAGRLRELQREFDRIGQSIRVAEQRATSLRNAILSAAFSGHFKARDRVAAVKTESG